MDAPGVTSFVNINRLATQSYLKAWLGLGKDTAQLHPVVVWVLCSGNPEAEATGDCLGECPSRHWTCGICFYCSPFAFCSSECSPLLPPWLPVSVFCSYCSFLPWRFLFWICFSKSFKARWKLHPWGLCKSLPLSRSSHGLLWFPGRNWASRYLLGWLHRLLPSSAWVGLAGTCLYVSS